MVHKLTVFQKGLGKYEKGGLAVLALPVEQTGAVGLEVAIAPLHSKKAASVCQMVVLVFIGKDKFYC